MNKCDEKILTELCAKVQAGELERADVYKEYCRIKAELALITLEELGYHNPNSAMRQEHWWNDK